MRSAAVNTIMQGIIKDFKDQKERERLQKMEEQMRQYVDEYHSLVLRCNALNGTKCKFSSMGNLESAEGSILNWLIGDLFVSCSYRNIVYAKLKPRQCSGFAWMGYLGDSKEVCRGKCHVLKLRTVPTIVIVHKFCASQDTQISYG